MTTQNPFATVLEIAGGYALPRCLHVVAEHGIADALGDAPQTPEELAEVCGVNPDALGRMLRLLAAYGVFQADGSRIRHSPASELLRTNHPQSMRSLVRMFGLRANWQVFEQMDHTLKTGRQAAEKVFTNGFWGYFADHPEEFSIFNNAMVGKASGQVSAIVAAYDFSGLNVIGDIGGGHGHLLRRILDSQPSAKGILFDQPYVIKEAAAIASDRLFLQAGDFFKDSLPICDAYVVMEVIHDWNDQDSIAILKAIRRAAPSHAKLLLMEQIIPDNPGPDWAKTLDIHMLTLLGGRQRTVEEYKALLQQAGFTFQRRIDAPTGISIIEAA